MNRSIFGTKHQCCKVMHIGRHYHDCTHAWSMGGHKLGKCQEEKDLGILVSDDLKVGTKCNQAFSKGNRIEAECQQNSLVMVNLYKNLVQIDH